MSIQRFLGVDLAWREEQAGLPANETGLAAIDPTGRVLDAGWARGMDETMRWITAMAADTSAMLFVDAAPVVDNESGQRLCETQVGQRYGRWKVSANTTNTRSPRLAGLRLHERLQAAGWTYADGITGPPTDGWTFSECYPYTALVGAEELGYAAERPRYKRKPPRLSVREWRPVRAGTCDELIRRLAGLADADPPLLLDSNPITHQLLLEPSPLDEVAYKHREDLIDALLCAWTAALWSTRGRSSCQVLGPAKPMPEGLTATIIAPYRPEQRRQGPAPAQRGGHRSVDPGRAAKLR